jgi:acetyltransferase-like isoleucine patch superfamily enzyme
MIHDDTVIGDDVVIGDFSVLGRKPVKAKRSATTQIVELPPLKLDNGVIVGSHVTIYRGATIGRSVLLADSSQVREKTNIEEETIIGRNVTVENGCFVGKRCKIETNAYITAFSHVGEGCFIAPMVTFTNDKYAGRGKSYNGTIRGPHLEQGVRIGANATILPGLTLHEDAMVAAGSVVTKDVEARKLVMGSPARIVRDVPKQEWWKNQ